MQHLRCLLFLLLICAAPARAHDPFDGSTSVTMFDETVEVSVTLGFDASRALLQALAVAPADSSRVMRGPGPDVLALAPAGAARVIVLESAGQPLAVQQFSVVPGLGELTWHIVFARPQPQPLQLRATYFSLSPHMRPGALVVKTAHHAVRATAVLTREQSAIGLAPDGGAAGGQGLRAYAWLGVVHILIGFDHLLFLAALLLGVRRLRPMILIVTSFTLGHSLTLGMAGIGLVTAPASLVEPLIAASIAAAAVRNLISPDGVRGRYGMAALFGLIHGFGFAQILRETLAGQQGAEQGTNVLLPLLAFNLGVEAGQLLAALLMLPVLLALRRVPRGELAASALVILVALAWLLQRLGDL